MPIDEKRYLELADRALSRVLRAFDEIDSDDADLDVSGDVIAIRFRDGSRAVLNTQRPARQLWLAGGASAWHFDYDEARQAWTDSKGSGAELFATVARLASEGAGVTLRFDDAREAT
ncbi:MAG: iron donor protein CyaY [Sandaracinaceae bacterium]|nr:iron donor protein CyaY [Sandaracinaceae bacterium]